jgi:NAD(P)-dependent dehydrogenase (short-subunit alcohol dehydrogenase family)
VGDGTRATRHHRQCRFSECDGNADATRSGPQQRAATSCPIGRFVQPEEVAETTAFLLSEEAAAITGQQLVICGGSSLRKAANQIWQLNHLGRL